MYRSISQHHLRPTDRSDRPPRSLGGSASLPSGEVVPVGPSWGFVAWSFTWELSC